MFFYTISLTILLINLVLTHEWCIQVIGAALDRIGTYNDLDNKQHVIALIDPEMCINCGECPGRLILTLVSSLPPSMGPPIHLASTAYFA